MDGLVTVIALKTFRYQGGILYKGKRLDVSPEEAERLVAARQLARYATVEEAGDPRPFPLPDGFTPKAFVVPTPVFDPPPPDPTPAPMPERESVASVYAAVPIETPEIEIVNSVDVAVALSAESDSPDEDTTSGSPPRARRRRYRRRDLTAEE